jgi:glutathione S-transferase
MLLIGQFDSPYVRRVGIALERYGITYEHHAWSVFRDAERIAGFNPLRKVPTLVWGDGAVLCETFVCLDQIDEWVTTERPRQALLLPRSGPTRREGLRLGALCSGGCEKAVSLVYDREVRQQSSPFWTERCQAQIRDTLLSLEASCAAQLGSFLLGPELSHADIAVTCSYTFITETSACDLGDVPLPALRELAERCEALPEFARIKQPFHIPR